MAQMSKINVNGTVRSYNLVVPPDLTKKSALIIALHGFSGNAKTIERISNLSEYAIKYNFFVVYPNGYGTDNNVLFSWNAKFCCGGSLFNNSDDVLFIKTLIQELTTNFPINPKKILVTGISNGAMMVHRIGIELGDIISGIIPVAGAIGTAYPKPFQHEISKYPLDVIIFHGLKDTFIPYNGGKGVTGKPSEFLPVIEQVKYWVAVNQCDQEPEKEVLVDGQVIKEVYSSEKTGKKVIFYVLTEGTHTWPGGKKGLQIAGEPVPKEICNASQIIVDFISLDN